MNTPFSPERHEALVEVAWDADRARDAIGRIVTRTRAAASPHGTWPVHPKDGPEDAPPMLGLYSGSAGVIWALDALARSGYAPLGETFAEHLPHHAAWNREHHLRLGIQSRSYLMAQGGILLALFRTTPSADTADSLAEVIAANIEDAHRELMWGAPGSMIAALAMHQATGEPRWGELYRSSAEALERAFHQEPSIANTRIWTQELYGQTLQHYGLVHGFAGNAFALIAGRSLLEADHWAVLSARLAETLRATAICEGGFARWFAGEGPDRPGRLRPVQICHGAPGMIVGLSGLDQPIDDLLIAGAETTWAAGPLNKGAGLCHGTAGNGYAFLKLFARSGDSRWLDRARAFAMHAISQSETQAGGPRYTLWTGDLGLALYLADCIDGHAHFPTLDTM